MGRVVSSQNARENDFHLIENTRQIINKYGFFSLTSSISLILNKILNLYFMNIGNLRLKMTIYLEFESVGVFPDIGGANIKR